MDKLLTVPEVAAYLRLNKFTVYRMVERGDLPGIRVSDQWRFKERDLDAWMEQQKQRPKGKRKR